MSGRGIDRVGTTPRTGPLEMGPAAMACVVATVSPFEVLAAHRPLLAGERIGARVRRAIGS